MKLSLLLTALILTVALLTGWQQHRAATALAAERETLKVEITRLGVDPEWLSGERGALSQVKTMQMLAKADVAESKAARDARTRAFARELAAFAAEQKKRQKAGETQDAEFQKKMVSLVENLLELQAEDFRVLLDEFNQDASLPPEARRELVGMSIMMLGQQHPRTALSLLLESKDMIKENPGFGFMAGLSLSKLAESDPAAAIAWIDTHKDSGLVDDTAMQQTMQGVAKKDPELALRLLLENKEAGREKDPHAFRNNMLSVFGKITDPDILLSAWRKVGNEPAPDTGTETKEKARTLEMQDWLLSNIGSKLVQGDFEKSKVWLESATLNETEREKVVDGLTDSINNTNPAPWLDWMQSNVPEDKMAEKVQQIIPQWTNRDFNAVGTWLNAQPAGKFREQATLSFAETLAPHEPEAARQWLESVPESEKRRGILQKVEEAAAAKTAPQATGGE